MSEFDVRIEMGEYQDRPVAIVHLPARFRVLSSTMPTTSPRLSNTGARTVSVWDGCSSGATMVWPVLTHSAISAVSSSFSWPKR